MNETAHSWFLTSKNNKNIEMFVNNKVTTKRTRTYSGLETKKIQIFFIISVNTNEQITNRMLF